MSTGAYSPDKAAAWPDRIEALKRGEQPYPVHVQIILSDLCDLDCPQCFVLGTMISTSEGYLPIEEIEEGMRVFSHDGRLHTVAKTMARTHVGETIFIRPEKHGVGVRLTPEHPVWARRAGRPVAEWIHAGQLEVGDFVSQRPPVSPPVAEIRLSAILGGLQPTADGHVRAYKGKTTCPDRIPLNAAFGEIVGAFLGDGHVQRMSDRPSSFEVDFSFGARETGIAARIKQNVRELFGLDALVAPSGTSVLQVLVRSSIVGRLMLALCRTGSHDKQFHPALLGAPIEFLEGLIRGYAWADGCVDDKSFSTVSKSLALGVQTLALQLGLSPTLFEAQGRPGLIKGRVIHAIGSSYTIRFRGEDRGTYDRIVGVIAKEPTTRNWTPSERDAEGFVWLQVKELRRESYTGPVYNFEVEDTHTYIAENLVVHNCAYRMSGYSSNQLFNAKKPDGTFTHNPNRMLPTALVEQILTDSQAMGIRAIQFSGGGEPTIHPDCERLMTRAQSMGFDTALVTNGLHLTKLGDTAVKTKWLRVSIDAATADTYAIVRPSFGGKLERSKQNFFKCIKELEAAIARRNALGTDCVIGAGFVVQEANWREMAQFCKLMREIGVDNVRISGAFTPKGDSYHAAYREEALALEREAAALSRSGFTVHARFTEKLDDLAARPDYKDCWYQQFTTYIGGDGNLYRCCVQSYNRHGLLGNIVEAGGFKALWDSEAKKAKIGGFDARSCRFCQLSDRNRAINAAIKDGAAPPSGEIIHKSFV